MNYLLTKHFKKQLKRYLNKDESLLHNLENALNIFNKRYAISIGKGIYKIRIQSRNKGKSGGYRVYLLLLHLANVIVPLCIYSKNHRASLPLKELELHVDSVIVELGL
ncbi:type II toxin-antitoxin system RelE/ParE family toxin [Candidatus Peregrinibacteria bacterium]|nr:type II toxin-antitoxin system RelE/ParE family toxin [Candidatus Peregrinibacteria bacterium]